MSLYLNQYDEDCLRFIFNECSTCNDWHACRGGAEGPENPDEIEPLETVKECILNKYGEPDEAW